MTSERRIRHAEAEVFAAAGAEVEESYLDLATLGLRVRVLSHGSGLPVVLLHGVSLGAVAWAPLFTALGGCRLLAVDLPGHGLSDPVEYRRGYVRDHAYRLLEDHFDALELERANVIGHSLGGMFALWHAARPGGRIASLVAVGDPAVALGGTRVRMPLSLLTVRGVGPAVLRSPGPRPVYRRLLTQGLGRAEVAAAPVGLLEALRLSGRRAQNADTIASLMRAIDGFRRPRPESVLSSAELAAIATPTMFIWGTADPYLSPARARPAIEQMPNATLHELPAGHGPWLVHPSRTAELIQMHLAGTAHHSRAGAPRV
jgi:pimeloyl-ACP methyl ester carboxylesterase